METEAGESLGGRSAAEIEGPQVDQAQLLGYFCGLGGGSIPGFFFEAPVDELLSCGRDRGEERDEKAHDQREQ
jgi:hypothetical protein